MSNSSATAHPARRLVEQFVDVLDGADPATCELIMHPVYLEHARAAFGDTEPGMVDGPDHLRDLAAQLRAQFPDLRTSLEAVMVDANMVVVRIRAEGTNTGPLNGTVSPTGRRFSSEQSHWFRVDDDKLAEHWAIRDDLTTMLQLGLIRPPGPPLASPPPVHVGDR